MRAIRQIDRPHVSDLLGAQAQEGFIGEGGESSRFVVAFHGQLLGSTWPRGQRDPARRAVMSMVLLVSASFLPASIGIVRMRGSTTGRAKSIDNSPLSSLAPATSMPSASMNARWNCRAAM